MPVTDLTLKPLNLWHFYNDRVDVERIIETVDGSFLGKIYGEDFFTISSWTIHIRTIYFLQIKGDEGQ